MDKRKLTTAGLVLVFGVTGLFGWTQYRNAEIRLNIQREVDLRTADRWKKEDMKRWAEELGLRNPDIRVPKVERLK